VVGDGRMETNIVVRPSWLKNEGGKGVRCGKRKS